VFTRPDGRPLLPDVVSRAFRRQAERLALPRASLNSIRHVHATLLLQAGVPVKVVSERLGHSTIRLTLDIYAHVLPAMDAEAVERFAALLDAADPS
jgi:integrase